MNPILLAALVAVQQQQPSGVYQIDQAHAAVGFTVRLAGFNRVRGSFQAFDGHISYDPARPERSSVTVVIETRSINTGSSDRDTHLRGGDFFDAERFPSIRFRSTAAARTATGLVVDGELTIRDVTRPVRLPVELVSAEAVDPFGNRRVAFSASLRINRRDFGVVGPAFWNNAISDSVDIELEIPGRIWGYERLGFRGTPARPSIGRVILARRDSSGIQAALREARALYERPDHDSIANFSAFQFEIAAGRLEQQGQARDALAILTFATETVWNTPSAGSSRLYALRARLERHLGDQAAAARSVARAIEMDSTNTLALEMHRP